MRCSALPAAAAITLAGCLAGWLAGRLPAACAPVGSIHLPLHLLLERPGLICLLHPVDLQQQEYAASDAQSLVRLLWQAQQAGACRQQGLAQRGWFQHVQCNSLPCQQQCLPAGCESLRGSTPLPPRTTPACAGPAGGAGSLQGRGGSMGNAGCRGRRSAI